MSKSEKKYNHRLRGIREQIQAETQHKITVIQTNSGTAVAGFAVPGDLLLFLTTGIKKTAV